MYGEIMKVIGLASFIIDEDVCADQYPAYYTKLTYHLSWILAFSSINGQWIIVLLTWIDILDRSF